MAQLNSQFQYENDVGAVLIDVVQRDDVGMPGLPQDSHLPLDLLPPHPAQARRPLALLHEFGGKLEPRALLPALLHDGELPAAKHKASVLNLNSVRSY